MKGTPKPKSEDIELHPDAWDRFTEFVKRIAKAGPQHRKPKGRTPPKATVERVRKKDQ